VNFRPVLLFGFAALVLGAAATAKAHPVHASFAEVGYEPKTGQLEVALEVDARDLEVLLKARAGRPVDLDETRDAEKLVAAYVRTAFVVRKIGRAKTKTESRTKPFPLEWVGMELSGAKAVLYFAVPVEKSATRVLIQNRVFFDLEARQVNTMVLRVGERRKTLRFTTRRPRHQVELR